MAYTRETIIEKVNGILVDEFELEADSLTPEALLNDDLDLDSLDAVDMIVALEKSFGVRFDEEQARQLETMGALYDFVQRAVADAA